MTTWFTSDTHFGHGAILRLAARPYATVEAMDDDLVARWNAVVAPADTVWHLGDFSFRSARSIVAYRARLNGTIHLVAGNHDTPIERSCRDQFASIQPMAELDVDGHTLILCHYPLREWPKAWRGAWHLHGHVHGRLDDEPLGYSLDVGVDSHDYAPIGMARIVTLLAGRDNPFRSDEDRVAEAAARAARRGPASPGGRS